MTEQEFDELLRSKVSGCTREAGEDLWSRLDAGLARRKRARVIRRSFAAVAAAAACLAVGLVLSDRSDDPAVQENTFAKAEVTETEVMPIREQIRSVEDRLAKASTPARASMPAIIATAPEEELSETGNTQDLHEDRTIGTDTEEIISETAPQTVKKEDVAEPVQDIDWAALAREDEKEASRRSPLLALASNLTSNAAGDGFMAELGPSHASSQSGLHPEAGLPVPVDQPEYYMPLSFGAQIKIPLGKRLYAGIGASYSYIVSKYAALSNGVLYPETYSQLHYLGIPVNLQYNFIENRSFDAYASVGAMADKCLNARYVYGNNVQNSSVEGLQYSASAGVGVEYWMTRNVGIYLDPSIVWYFNNTNHPQPLSIRTAEPLQARFEAGLRFRFK